MAGLTLQNDNAPNMYQGALTVGDIAIEQDAPPWCGAVPVGRRGLAWAAVYAEHVGGFQGWSWRVVDRQGRVECSGFVKS